MASPNQHIIDALKTIAESYRNTGVIYKYKAYRTAIDTIRSLPEKVTDSSSLKGMKGIGKAMQEKVDEIIKTGELQQEKEVLADPIAAALKEFTAIHGIGAKLADKLVHEHGFRTLDDLEQSDLHLPAQVRLGLKYHRDSEQRIPFLEVREHYNFVNAVAHKHLDKSLILQVCGSHRRGVPTSGDIDVLMSHPLSHSESGAHCTFLKALVAKLRDEGYVVDTLVEGPSKFMGYCRLTPQLKGEDTGAATAAVVTRRLDIRWMHFDNFYPSLLYFTGSDLFNIHMRMEALKLGYTVNEYGIYKLAHPPGEDVSPGSSPTKLLGAGGRGERIEVQSEEDIFKVLGMKYVPPRQRNK